MATRSGRTQRVRWSLAALACVPAIASASCRDDAEPPAPRACSDVELLVAASDYMSTVICGAPGCTAGRGTTGVDLVDPLLVTSNGRAFALARLDDVVFELDPSCGTPIGRFSVHDLAPRDPNTGQVRVPANPQDVAAAPDGTLVIPLFNTPHLAFVKDGKVDGTLDLSSYDVDGNPQANAAAIVDVDGVPKAFVTLERLDDGTKDLLSTRPSQMLRIDVATRQPEAVVELEGRNPFNVMSELDGALYLAAPGDFEAADEDRAGIERFDTRSSTTRLLVRERELGGSVSEVAVTAGCGAAIVAGPQKNVNPTSLVTFDPVTGAVLRSASSPVLATEGYDLQGLAWRGRRLYVGDRRRGASGYTIHVFEADDACGLTPTDRSIDLPHPPVALRPAL